MSKPRVLMTDSIGDDLTIEKGILGDVADVFALNARRESELLGHIEAADAVMVVHTIELTAATLDRMKKCKLIVRCGVGFDNIDHAHAAKLGIPVANVPDYGTDDVADTAIGMLLALMRGFHRHDIRLRRGHGPWTYEGVSPLRRVGTRVLGIVGLGRIGSAVARRAQALGMQVIYQDPYVSNGERKIPGVRRVPDLVSLLHEADALTLHCPLSPETHGMIDRTALAQLGPGAYLVNTARGAIVDTSAVVPAIQAGDLAAAALDVLPTEPPASDDPLLRAWRDPQHPAHDRLLINPHAAFYSEDGLNDTRTKGARACLAALTGNPIPNVINGVK